MKLTATDLYEKGIVEQVIPEPEHLTTENFSEVTDVLEEKIKKFLETNGNVVPEELIKRRYERFRRM